VTEEEKIALDRLLKEIEQSPEQSLFDRLIANTSGMIYDFQRKVKPEEKPTVPVAMGIRG
jgi:hypothetical protein